MIRILDDADAGLRERLIDSVAVAMRVDVNMNVARERARPVVDALLATIPAVNDAAVERGTKAAFGRSDFIGRQKLRAAIAALGKEGEK